LWLVDDPQRLSIQPVWVMRNLDKCHAAFQPTKNDKMLLKPEDCVPIR
jgi:hypothetical protein